jgi:hypothetical protein
VEEAVVVRVVAVEEVVEDYSHLIVHLLLL